MKTSCPGCGAALEAAGGVVQCPYCGRRTQVAAAVLAQALRIETVNDMASVLIPRWTAIPASLSETFSTGADNQAAVSVHILQGDDDALVRDRSVGRFTFDSIPPAPRAVPRIQFTFDIASDGRLSVQARNLDTGKEQTFPSLQLDVLRRPAS
ncbi:MAG: Hsp70 family protein [Chloroflexota bacterium]